MKCDATLLIFCHCCLSYCLADFFNISRVNFLPYFFTQNFSDMTFWSRSRKMLGPEPVYPSSNRFRHLSGLWDDGISPDRELPLLFRPVSRKGTFSHSNLKKHLGMYTQWSAFKNTDTLLLVSGVQYGPITCGELFFFNITNGFTVQCKVSDYTFKLTLDLCDLSISQPIDRTMT